MLHCSEGRIVNGSRACYGQFPWQVRENVLIDYLQNKQYTSLSIRLMSLKEVFRRSIS